MKRIAMWSGPRNISTAMMRAWENRPDTIVQDEPFYAHYLQATGIDHPGRDDVIARYETDREKVIEQITRLYPDPSGRGHRARRTSAAVTIYYQKHMTHHMLDQIQLDWMDEVANCFLIRKPQEVITSYIKVRPDVTLEEIGFSQQWRLFQHVRRMTGEIPPVLDARDVLDAPRQMLSTLCERLDVPFSDRMLSWPSGSRESDGVWAQHWYDSVWASTGFTPYQPKPDRVPGRLLDVLDAANELYEQMHQYRLLPEETPVDADIRD